MGATISGVKDDAGNFVLGLMIGVGTFNDVNNNPVKSWVWIMRNLGTGDVTAGYLDGAVLRSLDGVQHGTLSRWNRDLAVGKTFDLNKYACVVLKVDPNAGQIAIKGKIQSNQGKINNQNGGQGGPLPGPNNSAKAAEQMMQLWQNQQGIDLVP